MTGEITNAIKDVAVEGGNGMQTFFFLPFLDICTPDYFCYTWKYGDEKESQVRKVLPPYNVMIACYLS